MHKKSAIGIIKKLAPSATTGLDRSLALDGELESIEYSSHLGYFQACNLEFEINTGLYNIDQIAKVFKLLGDSRGKVMEGGCIVKKVKVRLETVTTEPAGCPSGFDEAKSYTIEIDAFADVVDCAKKFMQKNNTVSRFIVDGGEVMAFDGSRVFKTTILPVESGAEETDPGLIALTGLQFELRTEQLEPLSLFLEAVSDDDELSVSVVGNSVAFIAQEAKLVLYTYEFGKMATIEQIKPLFSQGDYYTISASEIGLTESIKNILALDDGKDTIIHFSKETQSVHNDSKSVAIDLKEEPIKKPFQVSGKFLLQGLSVFSEKEGLTLEVYDNSVVLATQFAKSCMLMKVTSR